jgi:hypothetical protein
VLKELRRLLDVDDGAEYVKFEVFEDLPSEAAGARADSGAAGGDSDGIDLSDDDDDLGDLDDLDDDEEEDEDEEEADEDDHDLNLDAMHVDPPLHRQLDTPLSGQSGDDESRPNSRGTPFSPGLLGPTLLDKRVNRQRVAAGRGTPASDGHGSSDDDEDDDDEDGGGSHSDDETAVGGSQPATEAQRRELMVCLHGCLFRVIPPLNTPPPRSKRLPVNAW